MLWLFWPVYVRPIYYQYHYWPIYWYRWLYQYWLIRKSIICIVNDISQWITFCIISSIIRENSRISNCGAENNFKIVLHYNRQVLKLFQFKNNQSQSLSYVIKKPNIIFIVGIVIGRYGKYHIGILPVSAN